MSKNSNITENRDKYLGGSSFGALLGVSPYDDIFSLITSMVCGVREIQQNAFMSYGNEMEPLIREYINKKMVCDFKEDTHIIEEENVRCNVDGYCISIDELFECKTTTKSLENLKLYLSQCLYYSHYYGKIPVTLVVYNNDNFDLEFKEENIVLEKRYTYDELLREFGNIDVDERVRNFFHKLNTIKEEYKLTGKLNFDTLYSQALKSQALAYAQLKGYIDNVKTEIDVISANMLFLMTSESLPKVVDDKFTITRVKSSKTTSESIDKDTLKTYCKVNDIDYNQFITTKTSTKKSYLKFTPKEKKENE